jgi:hypothetical protein
MVCIHVVIELLYHLNAETEGMVLDFGAHFEFSAGTLSVLT